MTVNVVELSTMAPELHLDGHLEECGRHDQDWRTCSWCVSAVSVPPLERLLASRHDLAALLRCDAVGTVAWVVAAGELQRVAADAAGEVERVHVASVRSLCRQLQQSMSDDAMELERRLERAVAADGAVHRSCDRTAGAIAAAVIQLDAQRTTRERLPRALRTRLERLAELLASHIQVAALLPWVERSHWRPLPALRTQPEWERRPAVRGDSALRAALSATPQLVEGSLESLVVESVIDQVTSELVDLGDRLGDALDPVVLGRSVHDAPLSASTRSLMWRIAKIDWHLTFVDSARAECWNVRTAGDRVLTDVPWHVALAIDATERLGLVSATHGERPTAR